MIIDRFKSSLVLLTLFAFASFSIAGKKPEEQEGYDKSKDVGLKAPSNAEILFDGTMDSVKKNWEMWPKPDMEISWKIMDDPQGDGKTLMPDGGKKWGTHDLVTKKKYTDYEGHVEFNLMGARGDGKAEGYANSGVYMQNRYEIQIESPKGKDAKDPYNWKIGPHGIAAFCMDRVPDRNAWRPNGEWHAYHFKFTAAKWDGDKKIANARATVWWNGIKVHDNNEVKKANGGIKITPAPGGLKLQEHGQDVRFRNVWIIDLSKK
ncbi:MAG: DUF1080 domain-containing protein [Lentisphaeraceae bacterium]|nr:DUF1080 domain-containing protein [Lentisphaeraceae bacterium]